MTYISARELVLAFIRERAKTAKEPVTMKMVIFADTLEGYSESAIRSAVRMLVQDGHLRPTVNGRAFIVIRP